VIGFPDPEDPSDPTKVEYRKYTVINDLPMAMLDLDTVVALTKNTKKGTPWVPADPVDEDGDEDAAKFPIKDYGDDETWGERDFGAEDDDAAENESVAEPEEEEQEEEEPEEEGPASERRLTLLQAPLFVMSADGKLSSEDLDGASASAA
jgi:hypothetical protein